MTKVDLRTGRFTPSRGLCGERVSHIEDYLSHKSGEWDFRVDTLTARNVRLDARIKVLEERLAALESAAATVSATSLSVCDETDAAGDMMPATEGGDAV